MTDVRDARALGCLIQHRYGARVAVKRSRSLDAVGDRPNAQRIHYWISARGEEGRHHCRVQIGVSFRAIRQPELDERSVHLAEVDAESLTGLRETAPACCLAEALDREMRRQAIADQL